MGWAFGTNAEGRQIGYGMPAVCEHEGCTEEIDCGLAYCCGGLKGTAHGGNGPGCAHFFCPKHLFAVHGAPAMLCENCCDALTEVAVERRVKVVRGDFSGLFGEVWDRIGPKDRPWVVILEDTGDMVEFGTEELVVQW
jgi:hypothetical protein